MVFEELKNFRPTKKPKAELKTLPTHLKYVFFENNETKLVIHSNSLNKEEEDQLVHILKHCKAAIGWHISDLKGISCRSKLHDDESRLIQGVSMITKMMTKSPRE